jgi:hypothetical protein
MRTFRAIAAEINKRGLDEINIGLGEGATV